LDRLRLGPASERAFVIDIYEAAIVQSEDHLLREIAQANRMLSDISVTESDLKNALSIANWWVLWPAFHEATRKS